MTKEKKDLYVFGYGMSLIIPYLIFFRGYSFGFNLISVVTLLCGFAFVLWVTVKIAELNPKLNSWILIVHLLAAVRIIQTGSKLLPIIFLIIAAAFLFTSMINVQRLNPVYKTWMKVGHKISQVLTIIVLGILYYLVFSPTAIFLRLRKIDYLKRTIDLNISTYWIKREQKEFNKLQYTKQF
ncbi:MAG: hypothetical protein KBD53_08515 [Candidatus Omnitrophica bacterium]|nr:hypothetical protein [Candidatus Omnitrophota bacterium]